jgi:inhibitor of KinA sporulation pathway (predicted exonuclease)
MAWWQKQSMEAQKEAFSGTLPLLQVLGSFSTWWNRLPCDNKNIFIWGNGADFDSPILRAAYQAVNMREPWAPFNSRCYRTLKNLYPQITADAFEGTKHNALHDATFQARHARKILHEHFKAKLPVGS